MPEQVRRIVRRLQPTGPRSFDEESWPIYVAVVVLCGYLAGIVLSVLHHDDPRLHANSLTWLVLILVSGVLAFWCISMMQSTAMRRTLILSILLSLIINVSLLIMMAWTNVFRPFFEETHPKAIAERKKQEIVIPEYPVFNDQQQQRIPQEHERPVETGQLNADERVELTRQSVEAHPQEHEQTPSPEPSPQQRRVVTKPERVNTPSAPRQHNALAKLSRQALRADLNISHRPNMPAQATRTSAMAEQPTPNHASALPERQRAVEAPPLQQEYEQAPERVETVKLSREADTPLNAPKIASLPTLRRRLNRPRQLPKTTTPIESDVTLPQETSPTAETPSAVMAKRTTSAPDLTATVDLQPRVANSLDRRTRIDQPEAEMLSTSLSRTRFDRPSPRHSNVEVPTKSDAPADSETMDVEASAARVAQQQQTSSPSRAETVTPSNARTIELQPSAQALARATSAEPSIAKTLAREISPRRARQTSQRMASVRSDSAGSVEASFDARRPSPASEPSRLALSRSSVGLAGVGDAANLERGVAAPDSPISIASASANRERATQAIDPGPALSPSTASLTRRLRANSQSPRTSMQAQPVDRAMVTGTTATPAEAASSSATLERVASNAPMASVTAAKGTSEVDLGPTRIAADTGSGRAEGGGQPEVATGEVARALPRENSIAGQTGIRTRTEADTAMSPAAQDTATTDNLMATATGTSLARSAHTPPASGGSPDRQELTDPTMGEIRIARANTGRSEPRIDDDLSSSVATGGTSAPGRTARSIQLKTSTDSEVPMLASTQSSDGSRRGDPLDAQGARPQRSSTGTLTTNDSDFGAFAAKLSVDGSPDGIPTVAIRRNQRAQGDEGERVAVSDLNVGAPRRQARPRASGAATNVELDPEEFAVNTPGTNQEDAVTGPSISVAATSLARTGGGALAVEIDAPDGGGGLGDLPSIDAGILTRTANPESELVGMQPARFLRRTRPRASLSSSTTAATTTKAYRRRVIRRGDELAGERGLPSPKTEAAIELGLSFLSKFQSSDGSWSLNNFADGKAELPEGEGAIIASDTAATGLSLLAFLGAGYHHHDDKYQEHVKNGLDFLLQHQNQDGDLYIDQDANSSRSAWLYSHSIATIALCEAYGMTLDPELKDPAQRAVDFIIEAQHPTRGGWRYSPAYGSDTSVSGWMTMALKSAELAELDVPSSAYDKIRHWLDLAKASDTQPFLFRYNPYAPDTPAQRHGRRPTRTITAVGLLMRQYTGWRRDDANMVLGARTLAQNRPEIGTSARPRRDTYYWYYATQVMFHMGGDYWVNWNQTLHPLLTSSQVKDGPLSGSWNPQLPVPDRWGAHGGRLYVTTMNLLSLEVFYRHLPLYEETLK